MKAFLTLFSALSSVAIFASTTEANPQNDVSYTLVDGRQVVPLELFQECEQCPEMIVLPLGSFMMGATPMDSRNPYDIYGENASLTVRDRDAIHIIPSEHPRHRVEIDIPVAMGRNEVTHAEWMACVDAGGCTHVPEHMTLSRIGYRALGPDHPVINVSYLDALEYVAWLNSLVGADVYRLPTEAEWEYAARAGTTTRFAQGDDLDTDQANFSGSLTERTRGIEMPHLVDRHTLVTVNELDAANGWGLRHMSGNAMEVTQSCWSDEHLGLHTSSAYLALYPIDNSCDRRVAKGAGFNSGMDELRPARRFRPTETFRRYYIGFRVLREMNQ